MHDGQLDNGMWDTIWDVNSGQQVNSQCHPLLEILCVFQLIGFQIMWAWQRGPTAQYDDPHPLLSFSEYSR